MLIVERSNPGSVGRSIFHTVSDTTVGKVRDGIAEFTPVFERYVPMETELHPPPPPGPACTKGVEGVITGETIGGGGITPACT